MQSLVKDYHPLYITSITTRRPQQVGNGGKKMPATYAVSFYKHKSTRNANEKHYMRNTRNTQSDTIFETEILKNILPEQN